MKHLEAILPAFDGISLHTHQWLPDSDPRALIIIVHGVTEHSGRYLKLIVPLVEGGFGVASYDLRGHGRSGGVRGHVESWRDYTRDLASVIAALARQHPSVPVFLFGHSLGSLIVLGYSFAPAAAGKLAGVIVCGTAVDPCGIARPMRVAMARALSRVWPKFRLRVKTAARAALSRDPVVEAEFRADPLRLGYVTVRFGAEMLALIERIKQTTTAFPAPLLMLHGGADRLNSLAGARKFFGTVNQVQQDKELIVYEGGLHEPHNDLEHVRVANDVCAWLEKHCPVRGSK